MLWRGRSREEGEGLDDGSGRRGLRRRPGGAAPEPGKTIGGLEDSKMAASAESSGLGSARHRPLELHFDRIPRRKEVKKARRSERGIEALVERQDRQLKRRRSGGNGGGAAKETDEGD